MCSSETEGNLTVVVASVEDSSVLQIMIDYFTYSGIRVSVSAMALMQDRHDIKVLTRSTFSHEINSSNFYNQSFEADTLQPLVPAARVPIISIHA